MDLTDVVFIQLFREACEKCFGYPLSAPLSETDSRHLSNKILERTGLMIGVKSIKNYSIHVLKGSGGKKENPSIATLDTLARYVRDAPPIDDILRQQNQGHHPHWFEYKSDYVKAHPAGKAWRFKLALSVVLFSILAVIVIGTFFLLSIYKNENDSGFVENFNTVGDSLLFRGWSVKNVDTGFWKKRAALAGHLTQFTLKGDNWPGSNGPSTIRNLLVRTVKADCFITEIHWSDFFPNQSWQQAGILLSEDSTFTKKVVRISIGYNDFFGGYEKSPEMIIQVVSSEIGNFSKPEEIAHIPIYTLEKGKEDLVRNNLAKSSLRIEKKGQTFRFLYTTSPNESFAFNEAIHRDLTIKPKYLGIFAIQGLSEKEAPMPVHVDSFAFNRISCRD